VPPPQETEQALQALQPPLTAGLAVLQESVVPVGGLPKQFQLLVQAPSAVSLNVPLVQVLVEVSQAPLTGSAAAA
jgi:hypothetical protein